MYVGRSKHNTLPKLLGFSVGVFAVPCTGCGEINSVTLAVTRWGDTSDAWLPEWVKIGTNVQRLFTCGMWIHDGDVVQCSYNGTIYN